MNDGGKSFNLSVLRKSYNRFRESDIQRKTLIVGVVVTPVAHQWCKPGHNTIEA